MSGPLPPGLLSISIPDPQTIDPALSPLGLEPISVEVLHRLWKSFSASRHVLEGAEGQRLQNLAWRIWSNPALNSRLPASRVWELAFHFGQGYNHVAFPPLPFRPTSTASRVSPEVQGDETINSPNTTPLAPAVVSPHGVHDGGSGEASEALSPRSPQSILKKTKPEAEGKSKSVTLDAPESPSSGDAPRDYFSVLPTAKTSLAAARTDPSRTSGASKKRTGFVASTGARAKTRPSIGRKRSSQGSVQQALEQQKAPLKTSPGNTAVRVTGAGSTTQSTALLTAVPSSGAPLTTSKVPSASSWQSVEEDNRTASDTRPDLPEHESSLPLVDPDFRSKFAENQRSSASSSNLAAAARQLRKSGSSVRFADELPPSLRKGKDTAQTPSGHDDDQGDSGSAHQRERSGDSQAVSDSEDSEVEIVLPRTRSHLSLLIESERRVSGSNHLGAGSAAPPAGGQARGRGMPPPKKDSDDELIQMARGDGVTKAGGVRSAHRLSGGSEHRYRSPTPPPLYG